MSQLEVAIIGRLNNKAIVDENGALKVSGVSADISQAQIQAAFEAALDSKHITQGKYRASNLKRIINNTAAINVDCYSYSVANVGSVDATINTTATTFTLKPNEVVNSEAGSANNMFVANSISINATGTEVILSFIS
jgi:hypothetical protein